jgi:hypothetical protein
MSAKMPITAVVVAGLALCGCAATPQNVNSASPSSAVMAKDTYCLTATGSRVKVAQPNCEGYGRTYTGEDIQRTGSPLTGDALALMDPSITVHH